VSQTAAQRAKRERKRARRRAARQARVDAGQHPYEDRRMTWEDMNRAAGRAAFERGESYAGIPMPLPGLQLEPRFPRAAELLELSRRDADPERTSAGLLIAGAGALAARPWTCRTGDVDERVHERNSWWSFARQAYVKLVQRGERVELYYDTRTAGSRVGLLVETLDRASAWPVSAEARAMEKLRTLIPGHAWDRYFLTGAFLESSPRSGVTYLFRRSRPTLALRPGGAFDGMHVIAALCLHPLGYYLGSYAGVMVPTDDVIAHLLMVRGDEHRFWRQANQHPAWAPEAGI
jgi:hypothetical protein